MPDEALHILRRVTQEQAELMGEFSPFLQAAAQAGETLFRSRQGIPEGGEQRGDLVAAEILLQLLRQIDIEQRLALPAARRASPAPR